MHLVKSREDFRLYLRYGTGCPAAIAQLVSCTTTTFLPGRDHAVDHKLKVQRSGREEEHNEKD